MAGKKTGPRLNPRDIVVGENIRNFRIAKGYSQGKLGLALVPPVSFQQVQKYEKGINRISATRALQIAKYLEINLEQLLGKEAALTEGADPSSTINQTKIGQRMVVAFIKLPQYMQIALVDIAEVYLEDRNAQLQK